MTKYSHKYNVILDNMDMVEYRLRPVSAIMYLQDSFARYCATKKVAAYDLFPKNIYWVIGELNIEFNYALPFWSEEIEAQIWISEMTTLKIYTDFKLYYKNIPVAQGNGCWFLLNMDTKRPVKTDILKDKMELCNEFTLGEHKKFVIENTKDLIVEIQHKNNLSDIDFNNHVNNKSYINIAEVTIPENFKKTNTLKKLYVKFCRESFLNDILICRAYKTAAPNTFVHKIMKDETSICEIQTEWTNKFTNESISEYELSIKSEI